MANPSVTLDGLTGRRFAEALQMANLSKREMAHNAGIPLATIERYLRYDYDQVRAAPGYRDRAMVVLIMNGVAIVDGVPQRVEKQEAAA